jgi:Golgi phosphoprotein 3 GPP34
MDAETPATAELSLPQAFLLLATNDKDGKPAVPAFALRTTVAGAILAELELIGAVGLEGKHVRATGAAPHTDFQHELELIRGKSRPHTPKQWVAILEGRAEVQRVYEGMASRGIVEHVGAKHLGLFKWTRYPEKDHGPEAAFLKKIEAALSGAPAEPPKPDSKEPDASAPEPKEPDSATDSGSDGGISGAKPDATAPVASTPVAKAPDAKVPDARTAALIALLQAAGLLRKLFPAADRSRVMKLTTGYWPSLAVEDELRLTRLAMEEEATL